MLRTQNGSVISFDYKEVLENRGANPTVLRGTRSKSKCKDLLI